MTGTLDPPFGPSQMKGLAVVVARQEIGADRSWRDRLDDRL